MRVVKRFSGRAADAPEGVRLVLCDQNPEMADAWIDQFRDLDAVEIAHGSLFDVEADALVSPANSFGDMGGGIDQAIDNFYGGAAQERLMALIRERFLGELPVGMGLVVPLGDVAPQGRFPFMVAAPTMRIPGGVSQTVNAYLSLRGALVAVLRYNSGEGTGRPIRTLAVPGLCTGVGGMDVGVSAEQMRAAYDSVLGGGWREVHHPAQAPFAFGRARRLRRE